MTRGTAGSVLGIDSSTQSTKVERRAADSGRLLGVGRAPHPITTPPRSEQDPRAWETAFAAATAEAGGTDGVVAVAVAGQQHGLVCLDEAGAVVRPAKLWNDTESAPDAEWLLGRLDGGAAAWARACGSVPRASFTVTKLSWLHRTEPQAFERTARVLLPHDWLTHRLTSRFITDRGDASGTGYWSPADGAYRWDLLAIVDPARDWTAMVPAVLGPTEAAGEWQGAVVGPGTGDNMAAALALGLGPGDVGISVGTSGTVFAVSDRPVHDPSGLVAGFADATGRYLPLVCTLNAARVLDTVAGLLGADHAGLDRLAGAAATGAGGLTLLPYLDGERTPDRPDASGLIGGLRTTTRREDLARAAVEGVACGLLDGLDALAAAGVGTGGRLVLVGGGARSPVLRQALADLAGRPLLALDDAEPVATGAALQAAAVASGRALAEVHQAWAAELPAAVEVAPAGGPGAQAIAAAVRERYAEWRETTDPSRAPNPVSPTPAPEAPR